jgi:hypothetical protein
MRLPFVTLLSLAVVACASTQSSDSNVKDGDAARLNRECKLLGTVTGRSLLGGMADNARKDSAMAAAREKAADMGATDVYFVTVDTSGPGDTAQATARAFSCK